MSPHDRKIRAIQALRDAGIEPGDMNHLIEDSLSVNRTRQVLVYLSEMHLQIGGSRCGEVFNQVTSDATEGLGWILLSCAEALELFEENRSLEAAKERQALREVRA